MEEIEREIRPEGSRLKVAMRPFEVVTLRLDARRRLEEVRSL
jgi:hypothetical protein